jgi:hypothetical protein
VKSSILSFPERGPWGDPHYRGNCSGHVVRALLDWYRPRLFVDPMEGSGTSRDVARELGVPYEGLDLRDGFDLVSESLRQRLPRPADLVFVHPPYWVCIPYSGTVWGKEPDPRDLSHAPGYGDYLERLHRALRNAAAALAVGGHLAVLIGDIRRQGRYYSPQAAIIGWEDLGAIEGVLIKVQHNTRTEGKTYAGRFIPILHEYLIVIRREMVT